jgi:hypothetical protein
MSKGEYTILFWRGGKEGDCSVMALGQASQRTDVSNDTRRLASPHERVPHSALSYERFPKPAAATGGFLLTRSKWHGPLPLSAKPDTRTTPTNPRSTSHNSHGPRATSPLTRADLQRTATASHARSCSVNERHCGSSLGVGPTVAPFSRTQNGAGDSTTSEPKTAPKTAPTRDQWAGLLLLLAPARFPRPKRRRASPQRKSALPLSFSS